MTTIDVEARLPNRMVIGGDLVTGSSSGHFEHVNPATGKFQRAVPMAGADEIDRAVGAARASYKEWRAWSPVERRRVLLRFADLIRRELPDLATTATLEIGTPRTQASSLVQWAIDWLEEAAGWADKLYGQTVPLSGTSLFGYTAVEPCGVVAAIATWNGSIGGFGMSVSAPLAAGCTVVAKPSELAPFAMFRAGELALQAGLPPGVLNVVTGGVEASQALVTHPDVDKVAFTGSPPTARRIAAACAEALIPCVLELGGKSANIVLDDADIDAAVSGAMLLTSASGQVCTLGSRLLVHRSLVDRFVDRLVARMRRVKQGNPFDSEVEMGPVINEAAADRILGVVSRARSYARVEIGGQRVGGELAGGFFVEPTLVCDVANHTEIAQNEIFGPVAAVLPFEDDEEAVAIANDTAYGLAAYVYTRDISRAHRMAAAVDAGNVGVNGGSAPAGPALPFGGRKHSGYGKQGGWLGAMEFVNTKTIEIRL